MADIYAHDEETMAELVLIISLYRMGQISREIVLQDLQYHFLQYPILEIEFMRNLPPNMTQFSYMRTQFRAQEIAEESDPRYGLSFGRTSNLIANFSSGLIVKNGRQEFLPQRNIENNGDDEDFQILSQSSAFVLYSTPPRFLNNPFAKITDHMHICNRGSMNEDYKTCIIHGQYRTCAIHNSHRSFNNVPQNNINTFEASNSGAASKTLHNIAITKDKPLSGVRVIHRIVNIIISHRCFGKILPSKIIFDPRVLNTKSHNISRNRSVRPVPTFSKRKGSRNFFNLKVSIPAPNVNKIPEVADIKLKDKTSNTSITTASNIQGVPSVFNVNVTNAVSNISTSIKASNISIVPSVFNNITGTTFGKGVISSNINFTPITSNTNTTHMTANSSIAPTAPRENVILTSTASHVSIAHTVSTASVSSSFQHSNVALTPTNISIAPQPSNFNLGAGDHSNVISSEAANHSVTPVNHEIFRNSEIPSISIFPVSTTASHVNESCIAPIFTLTPINNSTDNVPSTSNVNRTPIVPNINMAATDKNIGDTSSSSGIKFSVRRRGICCPVFSAGRRRFDFHGGLRANKNNVDRRAYSESENLEEVVGPNAASESYEDNIDSFNTSNNVFIGGFEEESFSQPYLDMENVHNANANMRNIYARKLKGAYYNINHLKYGNRYIHKPISVLGTEINKIGNNLPQCGACAACRYSSTSPIPLFTRQGSNCPLLHRALSHGASSREPNQVTNQSRRSHESLRFQNRFGHRTNRNRCGRKLNYNPESSEDK